MNRPNPNQLRKENKKFKKDQWFGAVIAVLTPLFGIAILSEIYPNVDWENLEPSSFKFLLVRLLTFGVLINAGVLFLALRFNRESLGRGVLLGTLLVALIIIYFKFF